jgi:hypothetical protein
MRDGQIGQDLIYGIIKEVLDILYTVSINLENGVYMKPNSS